MAHRAGYLIHQQLHASPRSTVFRATRLEDGRPVILKQPSSDYLDRRRTLELHHEYAMARRAEGSGVIQVLALEEHPDRIVLVQEDIGGTSLRQWLDARGALGVAAFLDIALSLAGALEHVHHRGVTHKNLKPHNIIINPTTGVVKLTDFALAVGLSLEAVRPEPPSQLMGTLAYMAPEQTGRMNRGVDYRSDFYALGATFFELLTGRLVFATSAPLELIHAHVAQVPPSPRDLAPQVPKGLAAVVLKLLAKAPEERYQSAWGLIADLRECQRRWREGGTVEAFALGSADRSLQFRIPQGLYGRDEDIARLTRMHARAVAGRGPLLLISGPAGVGKSSLVHELQRVTAASRSRFVVGKCEQLLSSVPLHAVHQALRRLVRQTLEEGAAEASVLRERLEDVLGVNTAVLVEAVPEARALVGEQPPPNALSSAESSNRLTLVLARTLQVFASPQRPLVLFLDDLQWTDGATLALLQSIAQDTAVRHLLLVGAYRDTEVTADHPLGRVLAELRDNHVAWEQLELPPLELEAVARMVRETTAAQDPRVLELARLIHTRTGGNPFAVKELLRFLHQQGLLRIDPRGLHWEWDLARIESEEVPEDVAGLMATGIRRLPAEARELLQRAACLGMTFGSRDLTVAHGATAAETMRALWTAVERGLVLPSSKDSLLLDPRGGAAEPMDLDVSFSFLHDRVRQAAYALIPSERRAELHVETGLRLYEHARKTQTLDTRMFTILPHLGHAPERIGPDALRLELADLYLVAGSRAKTSGVYRTACEFFRMGERLIPEASREQEHARLFVLQKELAESFYLVGEVETAATLFAQLIERARAPAQRASILGLQSVLSALNSRHAESLGLGLEGLRLLGLEIPGVPDEATLAAELRAVDEALGGRGATELIDLPPLTDPAMGLAANLLASVSAPAYFYSQKLFVLLTLRLVRVSLEHGNSRHSSNGYALYGLISSNLLGDPDQGLRFSQLAVELSARFGEPVHHARALYIQAGYIDYWTRSARAGIPPLATAYKLLLENGDWQYAGYCFAFLIRRRFAVGEHLSGLATALQEFIDLQPQMDSDNTYTQWAFRQLILRLTGAESQRAQFHYLRWPASKAYVTQVLTEEYYLFRQPDRALAMAEELATLRSTSPGAFMLTTHALYYALSAAAVYPGASEPRKQALLTVMEQQGDYLEQCARRVPENFAPSHLLVRAELDRVNGRHRPALTHYEQAIQAARDSGFTSMEALACEQTCRFLADQERGALASAYLLEALNAYERWGAAGKARHLAAEFARLLHAHGHALETWDPERTPSSEPARAAPLSEALDLSSVMKASRAISSELQWSQLATNLIDILIENAGAQRGALVLERQRDFFVEVVGEVGQGSGPLVPAQRLTECDALSTRIAERVLSTGTPLLLDDASAQEPFRSEPYIARRAVRSVLCAPIHHRKRLLGLVYLENNLTAGAFNAHRLKVLGMLSAQAAISLENAGLYRRLEESHHTLEQRVQERTEELHHKNAELQRALERLKTMQAQIITQEKLASLGALTAGIAHELKNPLNFVKNFSELSTELVEELQAAVKETPAGGPVENLEVLLADLRQTVSKVCEHEQRASGIINGMLLHSRNNRGQPQPTSINQLVEEALRLVQHGLRSRTPPQQVQWETAFDDQVPPLSLVPEDFRRVILNLLDNACYAAHAKGQRQDPHDVPQVKVSTCWSEGTAEIRVRDNGNGVPAEVRDKLFTPFFTTKPAGEGTGLGLSLSHDIIVTLGGRLLMECEQGRYTQFTIVLPGALACPAER